jgi:SNF2 family DNA or RNA helicase
MNSAVDFLVRSSLCDAEIIPSRRGRPAKSEKLSIQFLKSLQNSNPKEAVLDATDKELLGFSDILSSWTAALQPQAVDVPFKTCFRLESPSKDDDGDESDHIDNNDERDNGYSSGESDLWRLSFFLQARDDKSLLVPANEVWRTRSSALTLLKKRLSNPQEQLLRDLGRAERVFPVLKKSLEKARPTGLSMTTEAAYSFLRETAPLLEQNGFGVMLPSWWQRKSSQLGIKLRLKDAPQKPGSSGPSFLGLKSLVEYDWQLSLGDKTLSEAEFLQLARLKVPLVRVRGEWTELRASDIEEAIAFFKKNSDRTMTLSEALRLVLDLSVQQPSEDASENQSDDDYPLPIHGFSAEGQIEQMLKSLSKPSADLAETSPPVDLKGTLRPYQLRGVSWLEYLQSLGLGACLADDMGLGKTVELIAFLLKRKHELLASESGSHENEYKPSLLICPLSVAGNWQKEIERFAPTLCPLLHHGTTRLSGEAFLQEALSRDIVITTYSLAAKDEETLSAVPWSHVILDEAQAIKNQAALQTRSIKRLPSDHRIALTGTPVENRLSELWSIMDFLNPGYLGSSESFRRQFILPIEKYKDRSRSDALRSIIQPFVLRRLKTDPTVIQDLPEKMEMIVNYNLTEEQATLYSAVVEDMLEDIESQQGIKRRGLILAALTKLKQICNHPALFLQDASSLDGRSGKLSRLEEMLEEAVSVGDRSLIFTQFAAMGAMLRHHLQEKMGLEVLFLHGRTSKKKRDEMIARFQAGSTPVFILSLKAGGFGLNLTAANQVFHFDRWWNPAVENQATDRAFRIGQKKNVFVHKFVCTGTLEEKINLMIEQKKSLADSVIGSGESWLTEFSNEALRDMLTLRLDSVRSGGDEGGDEK